MALGQRDFGLYGVVGCGKFIYFAKVNSPDHLKLVSWKNKDEFRQSSLVLFLSDGEMMG